MSTPDAASAPSPLHLGQDSSGRILLSVRVQPRASRSAVDGLADGVLKLRLQAPPVDGKANAALLRFLGRKVLGVAPSNLEIVSGQNARRKVIAIAGLGEEEVRQALAQHL